MVAQQRLEKHCTRTKRLTQTKHLTQAKQTPTRPHQSAMLSDVAQSVINDHSIDHRWRAFIRYALEINDPWLSDLVRRADAGERFLDSIDFSLEPQTLEHV